MKTYKYERKRNKSRDKCHYFNGVIEIHLKRKSYLGNLSKKIDKYNRTL